ncbi:MAG TPA: SgcJ/EcaC family oxidoreductase [Micromonosporaceae bacterium]
MTTASPPSTFIGPSAADQAAVWAITQRIVAAWAQNDADAFAEVFADDGTMILPGVYRKGREEIRAYMAAAYAGPYKGTKVTGQPIYIRFLGPEAVLIITMGGVLAPGESQLADARAIRASWLCAKQDGQWYLAAYQNSQRD